MNGTLRGLLRPAARTRIGRLALRRYHDAMYVRAAIVTFDRPGWLYGLRGAIPSPRLHFRAARPVTEADVVVCERLIGAYALAAADAPPTSGIWGHEMFKERQRELALALNGGDGLRVAELLASMFRSDFVLGLASGSLGVRENPFMGGRFWGSLTLSELAALAESLGAARAETPQQGRVGLAFAGGLGELVADTEMALGTSLNFPDVGAAYGIEVDGRLISSDTLNQLYAATRIRDAIRTQLPERDRPLRVVEIGGGFGSMAYWLLRMMDLEYVIVDLPIVNVLQGYFLAQALGADRISLYGEAHEGIKLLPTHALGEIELPFDVLANKDSLPELPRDTALDYLRWARGGCGGIFYSYNHEAAAPLNGVPQNVVCELVAQIGGIERLRRDTSWMRRGYAEELYGFAGASDASPA